MTAHHPKGGHSSKKGPLSRPLSRSFLEGSVLQEVVHMALVFRTVVAAFAAPFAPGTTVAPAFAVTTRTAVATAAATVAAFTARTAITAGFARRAGVFERFAGFLIDDAHRQADLAARVDLEHLDLDLLPFGEDVGDLFDSLAPDLRDVDEAVLDAPEVHEGAEIDEVHDLAVIDLDDLGLLDDAENPRLGGLDLRRVGRGDLDDALVVDVDLGAGGRDDLAAHLAAGADDVADLRLVDRDRLDARRKRRQFAANLAERSEEHTSELQSLMRISYAV